MNISVREFLDFSYNHGYITIANNKNLGETLWEGDFETMDNHIDWNIRDLKVIKWGIENNGIVIYVNYESEDDE